MKKVITFIGCTVLLLIFHKTATTAFAACNWTITANGVTASTCGVDAASSEYYDYSAGADDATNAYNITIPNGVTVTVNAGTDSSHKTYLGSGQFTVTGSGTLAVSASNIVVSVGPKCYVPDCDSDGYSPTPQGCATTSTMCADGTTAWKRKSKLTANTVDCGDIKSNGENAHPGQASFFTGTFTNGVNASLTHDWDCSGTEVQQDSAIYTCAACTNGSGYASNINSTTGFITAVPACNTSGTYYTVTNGVCQDPAVANCSAVSTNAPKTEACN